MLVLTRHLKIPHFFFHFGAIWLIQQCFTSYALNTLIIRFAFTIV